MVYNFCCVFLSSEITVYLLVYRNVIFKAIYLFLAILGHPCCTVISSWSEQGLLLVTVQRLFLLQTTGSRAYWLLVVAACGCSGCDSWAPEHRLNSCGIWAWLVCCMWDLPGPGIKPVSLALAGRFFTIEPRGKPRNAINF